MKCNKNDKYNGEDELKICLINPPHEESLDKLLDPPLGLMYLASVIRNLGHDIKIIDLSFIKKSEWKDKIPYANLYGITVMSASLHHAVYIKDIIKNNINSESKIMVGGAHSSSLPRETMNLGFDIVIVGESELAIQDIIYYVSEHSYEYPTIMFGNQHLMDINEIPFPDRNLVPIKNYTRKVAGFSATSIIASRGCPYKCAFCINSTSKSKVRFRNVDSVINEIKEIIFLYNYKAFIFYDDTFTINPNLDELLEKIKELNIIFRCNGNTRKDTQKTFKKLYDAGCREICFGIESGSQLILDKIEKKVTIEQNKNSINNAKKEGLIVKAFLMVGSPGESWNTVYETIKFMNESQPDQWTLFNFVPLPGCDIYNNPEKYGIKIINRDYKQYFNIAGNNIGGLVCETEHMNVEEIKKARETMIKEFPKQCGKLQDYYNEIKH